MSEEKKMTGYPSIDKPWLKYYDKDIEDAPIPSKTMYRMIYDNNTKNLDSVAINYFDNKISYKTLFNKIEQLAGAFSSRGIAEGDVVTIISLNTPETIYCIYALNYIGATANLVLHYDEHKKKRCFAVRGRPFEIAREGDVFKKKDEIWEYMCAQYYLLMEKHSSYSREKLEKDGKTIYEQWRELKKILVADCEIPAIGYHLDLSDEKRIGKAKVARPVTTAEEVFAHFDKIIYKK